MDCAGGTNYQNTFLHIVRTKIDSDVANDKYNNSNHNEHTLLSDVKHEISSALKRNELETDKIFLISTRPENSAQWDYLSFTEELIRNTPEKNQKVLILALHASSTSAIAQKNEIMLKRIPEVCPLLAAAITVDDQKAVIIKEEKLYKEIFGLTIEDMTAQGLGQLAIQEKSGIIAGMGQIIIHIIASGFDFATALAGILRAGSMLINRIINTREKERAISIILVDVLDSYEKVALMILDEAMVTTGKFRISVNPRKNRMEWYNDNDSDNEFYFPI